MRPGLFAKDKAIGEERKKMAMLPYVHRMSHGLINVAEGTELGLFLKTIVFLELPNHEIFGLYVCPPI